MQVWPSPWLPKLFLLDDRRASLRSPSSGGPDSQWVLGASIMSIDADPSHSIALARRLHVKLNPMENYVHFFHA